MLDHVKPPRVQRYQKYLPTAYTDDLTMLQKVNMVIEFMKAVSLDLNEVVDFANEFDDKLKIKEDSSNIGRSRKLSASGNFTGLLDGRPIPVVFSELDANTQKIMYLIDQFSSGQTGLIIDGGFFDGGEIIKTYDGGRF